VRRIASGGSRFNRDRAARRIDSEGATETHAEGGLGKMRMFPRMADPQTVSS
jgi:hypothetical protein